MKICQEYANLNREMMADIILQSTLKKDYMSLPTLKPFITILISKIISLERVPYQL